MKPNVLALAVVATLVAATNAAAQSVEQAVIHGFVVDPMQAAVTNAEVTITGGGAPIVVRTDNTGRFAQRVPEGTYAITVIAAGFVPATVSVQARPGQTIEPRLSLAVA